MIHFDEDDLPGHTEQSIWERYAPRLFVTYQKKIALSKDWRRRNLDRVKTTDKARRKINKVKLQERRKNYYENNKEKEAARKRRWYLKHKAARQAELRNGQGEGVVAPRGVR